MSILEAFQAHLAQFRIECKSFHPFFEDALNYMLHSGGTHFRAQLLLGVVGAIKGAEIFENLKFSADKEPKNLTQNRNFDKHRSFDEISSTNKESSDFANSALNVALAIEMMHTYSLIHDDLPTMDNAPLRRAKATTHIKFDETTALLVGDALNTHAFYILATSNLPDEICKKCVEILAINAGVGGMVLGQACDCFFEDKRLNLDEIKFLHIKKTGALIAASLKMGAVVAGVEPKICDEIYKIGLNLGLAFQIKDDIIDATANSADAGKPTLNDTHKNSFTNLLGVEKATKFKSNLIDEILTQTLNLDEKIAKMIRNLIQTYLKG